MTEYTKNAYEQLKDTGAEWADMETEVKKKSKNYQAKGDKNHESTRKIREEEERIAMEMAEEAHYKNQNRSPLSIPLEEFMEPEFGDRLIDTKINFYERTVGVKPFDLSDPEIKLSEAGKKFKAGADRLISRVNCTQENAITEVIVGLAELVKDYPIKEGTPEALALNRYVLDSVTQKFKDDLEKMTPEERERFANKLKAKASFMKQEHERLVGQTVDPKNALGLMLLGPWAAGLMLALIVMSAIRSSVLQKESELEALAACGEKQQQGFLSAQILFTDMAGQFTQAMVHRAQVEGYGGKLTESALALGAEEIRKAFMTRKDQFTRSVMEIYTKYPKDSQEAKEALARLQMETISVVDYNLKQSVNKLLEDEDHSKEEHALIQIMSRLFIHQSVGGSESLIGVRSPTSLVPLDGIRSLKKNNDFSTPDMVRLDILKKIDLCIRIIEEDGKVNIGKLSEKLAEHTIPVSILKNRDPELNLSSDEVFKIFAEEYGNPKASRLGKDLVSVVLSPEHNEENLKRYRLETIYAINRSVIQYDEGEKAKWDYYESQIRHQTYVEEAKKGGPRAEIFKEAANHELLLMKDAIARGAEQPMIEEPYGTLQESERRLYELALTFGETQIINPLNRSLYVDDFEEYQDRLSDAVRSYPEGFAKNLLQKLGEDLKKQGMEVDENNYPKGMEPNTNVAEDLKTVSREQAKMDKDAEVEVQKVFKTPESEQKEDKVEIHTQTIESQTEKILDEQFEEVSR